MFAFGTEPKSRRGRRRARCRWRCATPEDHPCPVRSGRAEPVSATHVQNPRNPLISLATVAAGQANTSTQPTSGQVDDRFAAGREGEPGAGEVSALDHDRVPTRSGPAAESARGFLRALRRAARTPGERVQSLPRLNAPCLRRGGERLELVRFRLGNPGNPPIPLPTAAGIPSVPAPQTPFPTFPQTRFARGSQPHAILSAGVGHRGSRRPLPSRPGDRVLSWHDRTLERGRLVELEHNRFARAQAEEPPARLRRARRCDVRGVKPEDRRG